MVAAAIFLSVLAIVLGVRDVCIRMLASKAASNAWTEALSAMEKRLDTLEGTNLATRNNIAELKNFLNATRKR